MAAKYILEFINGEKVELPDGYNPNEIRIITNNARQGFIRFPGNENPGHMVQYRIEHITKIHSIFENVPNMDNVPNPEYVQENEQPDFPQKTPEQVAEEADRLKAQIRGKRDEYKKALDKEEEKAARRPGRPKKVDTEATINE